MNPVTGAVGLLSTRNWDACQTAVETVLQGGVLRSLPEFDGGSEANNNDLYGSQYLNMRLKRKGFDDTDHDTRGLDFGLTAGFPARMTARGREKRRPASPSDESETTTLESGFVCHQDLQQNHHGNETKLLRLFF